MDAFLASIVDAQAYLTHLTPGLTLAGAEKNLMNDGWAPSPQVPAGAINPVNTLFAWGRGVVVVIGIIGVLFCAGKMAVGKFGRSDLAAEGVGGLVWTVLGISLMLIAIPAITLLL